jgi:glycosyltransferase involved in cell wall biosynthesis
MRILHVFRGPIGGLFRHVCDLVRGQTALGHDVGIFCDSNVGGPSTDVALARIAPLCSLGIIRKAMSVRPSLGDFSNIRTARKLVTDLKIDVIHGHGAKGGLYSRLASMSTGRPSVYTPHGGSLHYNWLGFPGFLYLATEWSLRHFTSGLAFVCEYEQDIYTAKFGTGRAQINMVHNGLWADEFKPVAAAKDASDILFVGELCHRKGVDILLDAVAQINPERKLSVAIVGDGPDTDDYKAQAKKLGIAEQIHFFGRLGIAQALPLGKLFVLPSRAEAFPYVVLEVIAAAKPNIATDIAGLYEVLPESLLYETESVSALANKLRDVFAKPDKYQQLATQLSLQARQKFSADVMVKSITDFYAKLS